MKIHRVGTWIEHFELPRPDTIAFRTVDSMRNGIVRVETAEGSVGRRTGPRGDLAVMRP